MTENRVKKVEDEVLDVLLRQGFQELSDEEQAKALAEEQTVDTPGLDTLLAREKRKKSTKRFRNFTAVAAAVAVVITGVHMGLYSNVEAYRGKIQSILFRYDVADGGFGTIAVDDGSDGSDGSAVLPMTTLVEEGSFAIWLPEGYEVKEVDDSSVHFGHVSILGPGDCEMYFMYQLHENNELGYAVNRDTYFSTAGAEIEDITVNGYPGIFLSQEDSGVLTQRLMWVDVDYIFTLRWMGKDIPDRETMMTMAKSVDYDSVSLMNIKEEE